MAKRLITGLVPRDTLQFLPIAKKAARKRNWEARNKTVSFSVPPHMIDRAAKLKFDINRIAELEFALIDEISRVFVLCGIACYERSEIFIETRPIATARKLTIVYEEIDEGYPVDLPDIVRSKPGEKKPRSKLSLSFRWRDDTFKRISEIADNHGANRAEVCILMMETGIQKYLSGKIKLKKIQPVIENNISGWKEA